MRGVWEARVGFMEEAAFDFGLGGVTLPKPNERWGGNCVPDRGTVRSRHVGHVREPAGEQCGWNR